MPVYSTTSYIRCIDIYKAFLIIMVVIGHSGTPLVTYIYTFHMPAFFIVSGYLFNTQIGTTAFLRWGETPSEIGADAMARIPVFISTDDRYFQNRYQGIPRHGYSYIMNKMLSATNITVTMGLNYKDILHLDQEKRQVMVCGQPFSGKVIFTASPDELFDYKYGELPYRTIRFEFETIDQTEYQPAAVVNFPCNYDFTRITEFKKLTMQQHQKTVIAREFPLAYNRNDEKMMRLYPIPKKDYTALWQRYAEEAAGFPSIVLAGRLADYRYYTMAETIQKAFDVCTSLEGACDRSLPV